MLSSQAQANEGRTPYLCGRSHRVEVGEDDHHVFLAFGIRLQVVVSWPELSSTRSLRPSAREARDGMTRKIAACRTDSAITANPWRSFLPCQV